MNKSIQLTIHSTQEKNSVLKFKNEYDNSKHLFRKNSLFFVPRDAKLLLSIFSSNKKLKRNALDYVFLVTNYQVPTYIFLVYVFQTDTISTYFK